MKIKFENYKNRQGFSKKEYQYPRCRIKNKTAYFSKCAIFKYGFMSQQSLIWGSVEENLPCFKFCENGRKLYLYNKNKKNEVTCAVARVADFIADKFQGEFIVDEIESGIFVLRPYEVKNETDKETD